MAKQYKKAKKTSRKIISLKDLKKYRFLNAFTIVELIVVIAIIGVLSSIVLVNVVSYGPKARNAVRKAELKELEAALLSYYADNGDYPSTNNQWYSSAQGDNPSVQYRADYIPGLTPQYIGKLPADPRGGDSSIPACASSGWKRAFLYRSNGINYKLVSNCSAEGAGSEGSGDFWGGSNDLFRDPVRPSSGWMVCSGEPACSSW